MRFKGLDLNLLVALDVLLVEANVSRAADRLCLSQSATSGALARLREYFEDDLLVQVGRKMVLTPRAVALAGNVRSALVQIDGTIIQAPEFDPGAVDRKITIIASDYMAIVALADAVRQITKIAPNLSFVIDAPAARPREELERGEVELLAMPELYLSPDHPKQVLFTDEYCLVAWEGNSLYGDTMTEKEFFEARHVAVSYPTVTPSYETWFLENLELEGERKVDVVVSSFAVIPFMLIGTSRVALMHSRMATIFENLMPLRRIQIPIEIPPLVECLQWNTYNETDECLIWVREQLIASQTK